MRAPGRRTVMSRLVRSADFERVLRTRSRATTPHFAVHHLADAPTLPHKRTPANAAPEAPKSELSTDPDAPVEPPVDEYAAAAPLAGPGGRWFGVVVPKRHARRSVTRSLLKRQIRLAVAAHATLLGLGLWVVRLRAPFHRDQFVSAASEALKRAARDELDALLAKAAAARRPGEPHVAAAPQVSVS